MNKKPPQILKQTASYRLVMSQRAISWARVDGKTTQDVTGYANDLSLERNGTNNMDESYWYVVADFKTTVDTENHYRKFIQESYLEES